MPIPFMYQLSAFGSFQIEPSPENAAKYMNLCNDIENKGFISSLQKIYKPDPLTFFPIPYDRLCLISADKNLNIMFLEDRLDVNYNRQNDSLLCEENFFDFAGKIISGIMKDGSFASNRLAINVNYAFEFPSSEDITKYGKKYLNTPSFYSGKNLIEWNTRINSQVDCLIGSNDDCMNVITEISSGRKMPESILAIICHIDINTIKENMEFRFNHESINPFISNAKNYLREIKADVTEKFGN